MRPASTARVSQLLVNWGQGDKRARETLIPLVYDELRRLARHYLAGERRDHSLESAALVNEAYLHLVREDALLWQNRAHFFGGAARLMRHILVDHSRRAAKRGGGASPLTLDTGVALPHQRGLDLLALDDALKELAVHDAQMSRIVELRFFGGLSIEETSVVMESSPATVKRDWALARVWLQREIRKTDAQ
jgi:RNA polymerase sigma factor (TIGR02999 family)